MRVCFVTGEYPPMEGGVGAFTREVAVEVAIMGHNVTVLTRSKGTGIIGDPFEVYGLDDSAWGWNLGSTIAKWSYDHEVDVINVQFQTAAFDMHPAIHFLPQSVKGIPVVVTFHDLRVPYLFPKAGRVRDWIVRHFAMQAAGVIATDREDLAQLHKWGRTDATWIPIGSNVSTGVADGFDRAAFRQTLGLDDDDLLISYFGFLNESKGGLVLIGAVKHLLDAGINTQLVMIGGRAGASDRSNVDYGKRVDDLISQLGIHERVHWTGFVSDPAVSANFYASDVTALPYLDGVSLRRGTLMAALAHGRAIVTTNGPATPPELKESVKLVKANSAEALARGIQELWEDKQARQAFETAALETANYFAWDHIARETVHYFEAVING